MLAEKLYLNEGTGQECAPDRYINDANIRYEGAPLMDRRTDEGDGVMIAALGLAPLSDKRV